MGNQIIGWGSTVLALGLLVLVNTPGTKPLGKVSGKTERVLFALILALGCFLRLFRLGTVPAGLNAEEALTGVLAKSFWETGKFGPVGLTTQLPWWTGESTGPLLCLVTAPFVGLFGLNTWTVRLPLALCSCCACAATYGLGRELSGKRAGLFCMLLYACAPYYALMSRLTAGANLALALFPVALYLAVLGLRKPPFLYLGMAAFGLLAYTQDMFLFAAPCAVLIFGIAALCKGQRKGHALGALALGTLLTLPALLTLQVNLCQGQERTFMGILIPKLQEFDKLTPTWQALVTGKKAELPLRIWQTGFVGGILQTAAHMNMKTGMYAPEGMRALYMMSIPLMMMGTVSLLHEAVERRKVHAQIRAGYICLAFLFAVILVLLGIFGSEGRQNLSGATANYDYSILFMFDILLAAAGLMRASGSRRGLCALLALLVLNIGMLFSYTFINGGYQESYNVGFPDYEALLRQARAVQEERGGKIEVTDAVYPHIAPGEAAQMLASDVTGIPLSEEDKLEVVYVPLLDGPEEGTIYIVQPEDILSWDLDGYAYIEEGRYTLLVPETDP